MPLEHNGLIKLSEECGELIQAAMKKVARSDGENIHWDGSNLKERLEDEIADVLAACTAVQKFNELDIDRIAERTFRKVALFVYWHNGGTETTVPVGQPTSGNTATGDAKEREIDGLSIID